MNMYNVSSFNKQTVAFLGKTMKESSNINIVSYKLIASSLVTIVLSHVRVHLLFNYFQFEI